MIFPAFLLTIDSERGTLADRVGGDFIDSIACLLFGLLALVVCAVVTQGILVGARQLRASLQASPRKLLRTGLRSVHAIALGVLMMIGIAVLVFGYAAFASLFSTASILGDLLIVVTAAAGGPAIIFFAIVGGCLALIGRD